MCLVDSIDFNRPVPGAREYFTNNRSQGLFNYYRGDHAQIQIFFSKYKLGKEGVRSLFSVFKYVNLISLHFPKGSCIDSPPPDLPSRAMHEDYYNKYEICYYLIKNYQFGFNNK